MLCCREAARIQDEQHDTIVQHPHDKYDLSGTSAAAARMTAMEADAVASGLLDVRSADPDSQMRLDCKSLHPWSST